MTRPLRIEYDGAWYHVMNRGLERRQIYLCDKDYSFFLRLLKEITEIFMIEIHAFSLMPNHYHLLIHTPQAGLSRAMKHLNGVYTQMFNKDHKRDGPLFRGRYKAQLVDTNEYLSQLMSYIHINPVEAKICNDPKDHKWTSHKYYLKETKGFEWLCTEEMLGEFSNDKRYARKLFDKIVKSKLSEETIKEIEAPRNGILGNIHFKEWVNFNYVEERKQKDSAYSKRDKIIRPTIPAKKIVDNIGFCYNMTSVEVKNSKKGMNNEARSLAVYLMRKRLGYSIGQICDSMGIESANSASKIYTRFRRALIENKRLAKKIEELERVVLR
jgi:putative transposase